MKAVLLVALGGAIGALSRWGLVEWFDWMTPRSKFPWGIMFANLCGCLAVGVIFGIAENRSWFTESGRLLIVVGFLGSFTTYSTFGWNTFEMLRNDQVIPAIANVVFSVAGGLAAVWAGWALVRS